MLTKLLTELELVARAQALDKRFVARCGPSEAAYTHVNGIIACYHYLNGLGTQGCGVGENTVMCTSGTAHIYGSALNGHTQSYW